MDLPARRAPRAAARGPSSRVGARCRAAAIGPSFPRTCNIEYTPLVRFIWPFLGHWGSEVNWWQSRRVSLHVEFCNVEVKSP